MLPKTRIEYADRHWGIITGCGQPPEICLTRSTCWARRDHHRFWSKWGRLYNPDFSPRFNEGLLKEPFKLRSPAYILVGFTGDAFGSGTDPAWVRKVLDVVKVTPQHTYFFLTKSPENLAQFNPWPDNCFVGASVTADGDMTKALTNLFRVQARVRWLSIEPLLGAITMRSHPWGGIIQWVVIGAQTGPGAVKPRKEWIEEIIGATDKARVKLWIKDNLLRMFPQLPRRQERP